MISRRGAMPFWLGRRSDSLSILQIRHGGGACWRSAADMPFKLTTASREEIPPLRRRLPEFASQRPPLPLEALKGDASRSRPTFSQSPSRPGSDKPRGL
jgi:hypothetical protein